MTTLDRRNVNLTLDQTVRERAVARPRKRMQLVLRLDALPPSAGRRAQNRIVTALSARASGDFLDLKGLKNDPNMTGIPVDFSNRSFVAQLLKIIKQHFPQVPGPGP